MDAPWLVLGTDGKLTDGVDGLIFLSSFGAAAADGGDATAGVLADELPPPLPSPLLEPLLARGNRNRHNIRGRRSRVRAIDPNRDAYRARPCGRALTVETASELANDPVRIP